MSNKYSKTISYCIENNIESSILNNIQDRDVINNIEFFIENNIPLPDGKYIKKNGKDELVIECNYYNGKLHGDFVECWDNSKVHVKCSYFNGNLYGDYFSFYENGKQKIKTTYINGLLNGEYKEYDEEGDLVEDVFFINGEEDEFTSFKRKIKKKVIELNIITDKFDNIDRIENLIELKSFINSNLDLFVDNGLPIPDGHYEMKCRERFDDGKFKRCFDLIVNVCDGIQKHDFYKFIIHSFPHYHIRYNSKKSYTIINNQKNGEYFEYVYDFSGDNSYLSLKCSYENDKLNGEYITYQAHQNGGSIIEKRNYVDGNLHGNYILYNQDGSVFIETTFENNKCDLLESHFRHIEEHWVKSFAKKSGKYESDIMFFYKRNDNYQRNNSFAYYKDFVMRFLYNIKHTNIIVMDGKYDSFRVGDDIYIIVSNSNLNTLSMDWKMYRYVDDKRDSAYLSEECSLVNGKVHGEYRFYSRNGELTKIENYRYGEKIEMKKEDESVKDSPMVSTIPTKKKPFLSRLFRS
jgi:antitoxin component YwqK of YwqJK toxin-antitoxin module